MIPVNLSEPWYSEKCLQILEELDHTLARSKHMVGPCFVLNNVSSPIPKMLSAHFADEQVETEENGVSTPK